MNIYKILIKLEWYKSKYWNQRTKHYVLMLNTHPPSICTTFMEHTSNREMWHNLLYVTTELTTLHCHKSVNNISCHVIWGISSHIRRQIISYVIAIKQLVYISWHPLSLFPYFPNSLLGKSNLMLMGSGYPETRRCINAVR